MGATQARRWALFLFNRNPDLNKKLAISIQNLNEARLCQICFSLADEKICFKCQDKNRNPHLLCIVETPLDVILLDQTKNFNGQYFVLGHLIDPLAGIGPAKARFKELKARLKNSQIEEIILAFNQNLSADQTKLYLKDIIPKAIKITELAQGLPRGGDLEYIDQETLSHALTNRKEI